MMLSRVGVDLAKNVFQVHGVDRLGEVVWRRRLTRKRWLPALMEQADPGCEIGMEACASAHHWARELQSHGYTVRLIPPQFVKPYVKSNKNDANDAGAICEAMSRPNMRFVAVKRVAQQDIQATHRIRAELMRQRRAKHREDRLSRWVTAIATRRHPNVAAVALANKTARMAWAMLRQGTDYDPDFAMS